MPTKDALFRIVISALLAVTCSCGDEGGVTGDGIFNQESTGGIGGVSGTLGTGGTSGSGVAGASGAIGTGGIGTTGGMSDSAISGASGAVETDGMETGGMETGGTSDSQELVPESETMRELTVLVTNDDGVGADGIDLLVEELRKLPMVSVVVVAPAENRSAAGSNTTLGPVQHVPGTTKSGYPAEAVYGYPADSVIVAIEELGIEPDFVFSGTNQGANIGLVIVTSGTVGAARQAAKMGIPAAAVSQEMTLTQTDYAASVKIAIDWFNANRSAIEAGTLSTSTIVNINAPSCAPGTTVRGTVEVPPSGSATLLPSNCASFFTGPLNDIAAIRNGYASITPDLLAL